MGPDVREDKLLKCPWGWWELPRRRVAHEMDLPLVNIVLGMEGPAFSFWWSEVDGSFDSED